MKNHDHETVVDQHESTADGAVDAIAAMVIVVCIAAMGLLWISGH